MQRAPFLKSLITQGTASWGISHTRVPTESRPGHVAIIGGFYEDVSAVTRGWQENPVEFDSLFNESRWTWSFGSPDILPMFARGASEKDKVTMFMYEAHEEDFSKDASWLDTWVFEKFETLLQNATVDEKLNKRLHSDGIVFFLHLLGIDTNGHGFRPHSQEYLQNIGLVDRGIQATVRLIEDFYKDNKTAYIFTADHGMHNSGAHGDGHPDNTLTPLLVWGAGAATEAIGNDADSLSKDWGMDEYPRMDVEQADIAPLMSTLIGVPPPMNSVGRLPTRFLHPNLGREFKAKSAIVVARQVTRQYLVKEQGKMQSEVMFQPFEELGTRNAAQPSLQKLEEMFERAESAIGQQHYEEAEGICMEIEAACLRGLRYYQTYDRVFLRILVSLGYLGWIIYSAIFVTEAYTGIQGGMAVVAPTGEGVVFSKGQVIVFSALALLLLVKHSPFMYYVYAAFPVFFWGEVWRQWPVLKPHVRKWQTQGGTIEWILAMLGVLTCLELLTFAYFDRRIFSLLCLVYAFAWPMVMPKVVLERDCLLVAAWCIGCSLMGGFTWLPVGLHEHVWMMCV
jgi:phosphatidylinositol glycan class N